MIFGYDRDDDHDEAIEPRRSRSPFTPRELRFDAKAAADAQTLGLEGDQEVAYRRVLEYIESQGDVAQYEFVPPFVLTGLAGTGKTTLICKVIEEAYKQIGPPTRAEDGRAVANRVVVCSPTGKAAMVLNSKLPASVKKDVRAQTIHSFIYTVPMDPRQELFERLHQAEADVEAATTDDGRLAARKVMFDIQTELDELSKSGVSLRFSKRTPEELYEEATIIFVDEASMVGKELASDLLAIGRPLIFLGDGNQLPPVNDDYGVNLRKPNQPCAKLTQIRRQAADSDILCLSHAILQHGNLPPPSERVKYPTIDWSPHRNPLRHIRTGEALPQFIVYTNDSRHSINRLIRQTLYGGTGTVFGSSPTNFLPQSGEVLMIDDNAPMLNLMKGDEITVLRVKFYAPNDARESLKPLIDDAGRMNAVIEFRDANGFERELPIFLNDLMMTMQSPLAIDPKKASAMDQKRLYQAKKGGGALGESLGKGAISVMYKYALTCHKSQGSEWDRVVFFNDKPRYNNLEYIYTGITRARNQLTVVG